MRGIILAGGTGSRMGYLTVATNKHLLPVGDRPMIAHPLDLLLRFGIKDITVVTTPQAVGPIAQFVSAYSPRDIGVDYMVQATPGGVPGAIFASRRDKNDPSGLVVILGDNIFPDGVGDQGMSFNSRNKLEAIDNWSDEAKIFLKEVKGPDICRYGVARFKAPPDSEEIAELVEKPTDPPSQYALTGLMVFSSEVYEFIEDLKPSSRGELEIVDLLNIFIDKGNLYYQEVRGRWYDVGTAEALLECNAHIYNNGGKASGK